MTLTEGAITCTLFYMDDSATLDELCSDTGFEESDVELALSSLVECGVVREYGDSFGNPETLYGLREFDRIYLQSVGK